MNNNYNGAMTVSFTDIAPFLLYHSLVEKSFNIEQTIRNGANRVVCHKKRREKPRTTLEILG